MISKFFIPKIEEWLEADPAEIQSSGMELYLNKLWQLGCTLVADNLGNQTPIKKLLEGLPFVHEELRVHLTLIEDGWKPVPLALAETLKLMCYLDCNAKPVAPLMKKVGKMDIICDVNGISFYWGKNKVTYSSPLPF